MKQKGVFMKRLMALFLCMALLLAACGNRESSDGSATTTGSKNAEAQSSSDQASEQPSDKAAAQTGDAAALQSAGDASESSADAAGDDEDVAEIELLMWTLNTVPADVALVEAAINDITREKINTEVHLNIVEMGSYMQQANLAVTSGEKLDIIVTMPGGSTHFNAMSSQNQLLPLGDLLNKYGQDILANVDAALLDGTRVDGEIYAVTSQADKACDLNFVCRTDILEETGINAQSIQSVDDLTALFAKVKELHPEMIALTGGTYNVMTFPGHCVLGDFSQSQQFDSLGDTSMVLAVSFLDDPYKVVNYYESDQWKKNVQIIANWYGQGYVDKDASTQKESAESIIKGGNAFSYFKELATGAEGSLKNATGYDMTTVKVSDAIIGTSLIRKFTWAIPASATEPEAAMKFLNLMYSDADIVNLICWGIEGTHYVTCEDGTIDFPKGMDASTSGYFIGDVSSIVGNGFLAKVWHGQDPDLRQIALEKNKNAIISPLSGFGLDSTGLENEYTAITAATDEYRNAIRCGLYTEEIQAKFEEKLRSAGADIYVETVQKQMDEWRTAQGK